MKLNENMIYEAIQNLVNTLRDQGYSDTIIAVGLMSYVMVELTNSIPNRIKLLASILNTEADHLEVKKHDED